MSIGTISDAIAQFELVQQRIQQLEDGSLFDSLTGVGGAVVTSGVAQAVASGPAPALPASSSDGFAGALAQAQAASAATKPAQAVDVGYPQAADSAAYVADPAATYGGYGSDVAAALPVGAVGLPAGAAALPLAGAGPLSPSASALLTSGQQQFASTLAADTGLDPGVVSAWLLAEESGSAAQARQAAGNNDWLNIGYTGSGTYGASDPIWSDPVSAANATAAWMNGQASVVGYGTASPGIQAILQAAGGSPASQIAALQQSGWSSSGYPSLTSLYTQVI